jgi:hypothetical protein
MKEFLENFASILAAATISMLILAVCHELGYFWLIGYEFQALLTTTDYLINAIFWLPFALIFAYTWVDWWRFKDEPLAPPKRWRDRRFTEWIWPLLCTVAVVVFVLVTDWPPNWWSVFSAMTFIAFVWSKVWRAYAPVNLPEPFNSAGRNLVRLGPPAMFAVFAWGWINADGDLGRTTNPYIYYFKGKSEGELRIPLRSFDKGLLVRNPLTSRIEFRRWELIDEISKPQLQRSRGLLCFLAKVMCGRDNKPPPL